MFAIPHECMNILLISADELEIDFCNWPENWVLNMLFIIPNYRSSFLSYFLLYIRQLPFIDQILNWKMTSLFTMSSNDLWRIILIIRLLTKVFKVWIVSAWMLWKTKMPLLTIFSQLYCYNGPVVCVQCSWFSCVSILQPGGPCFQL